ncbi:hypothetical protein ACFL0F_01855 [Patescibacteria group bacterium]
MTSKTVKPTKRDSMDEIRKRVSLMREKSGGGVKTLSYIDEALEEAHDFIVSLYFEKALVYQHEYMEEVAKPKSKQNKKKMKDVLIKMEESTVNASDYVKQNNLLRWESRVSRFWEDVVIIRRSI